MESSTFSMELQNCFEGKVTNNTITPMDATEFRPDPGFPRREEGSVSRGGLHPGGSLHPRRIYLQSGLGSPPPHHHILWNTVNEWASHWNAFFFYNNFLKSQI